MMTWNHRALQLLKSDTFLSLLGNGGSAGLNFLMFSLLARWLPRAEMGSWVFLLSIYSLFDAIRRGLVFNAYIQQAAATKTDPDLRRWSGAAWQVNLGITVLGGIMVVLAAVLSNTMGWMSIDAWSGGWVLASALVSVPANMASWILLARSRFAALQLHKMINPAIYLLLIGALYLTDQLTFYSVGLANLAAGALLSVGCLLARWCSLGEIKAGSASERKHLYDYGKYSIGTLVSVNLLRNSDIFLIRMVLGNEAVALYSIPQRLIQLIEIPLRSIVVTSIPGIIRLFHHGSANALSGLIVRKMGVLWLGMLPLCLLGVLLAEPIVYVLAGEQYGDAVILVQIFMIYGALMPLDRYIGVTLDAIGKPQANFYKVLLMLVVNILGDCLGLWWFGSPVAVAGVSILTFASGIWLGFSLMNRNIPVSWSLVWSEGISEVRLGLARVLAKA